MYLHKMETEDRVTEEEHDHQVSKELPEAGPGKETLSLSTLI